MSGKHRATPKCDEKGHAWVKVGILPAAMGELFCGRRGCDARMTTISARQPQRSEQGTRDAGAPAGRRPSKGLILRAARPR